MTMTTASWRERFDEFDPAGWNGWMGLGRNCDLLLLAGLLAKARPSPYSLPALAVPARTRCPDPAGPSRHVAAARL